MYKKLLLIYFLISLNLCGMEKPTTMQLDCQAGNQTASDPLSGIPGDIKIEILACLIDEDKTNLEGNWRKAAAQVRPFLYSCRRYYIQDECFVERLVLRISKECRVHPLVVWLEIPSVISRKYLASTTTTMIAQRARSIALEGIPGSINMVLELLPPDQNFDIRNLILETISDDISAQRLKHLLAKGIDVNAIDQITGDNALHKIVRSFTNKNIPLKREQLKTLLDHAINIDHRNTDEKQTPGELFTETSRYIPYKWHHLISSLGDDLARAELKKRLDTLRIQNHFK